MSRRRIWLIIIGILMAGVSATWEMEKFVSSHGVNTAAVVGFEADAGVRGQDDGREALEEGRNGRQGEGLHLGMHQRPVGGQGIRRGAEGRGDCASSGVRPCR